MTSSLLFDGALELCDPDGHISDQDYWFEALSEVSFGDPKPIEVTLNSMMRDGAIVSTAGDENRESFFLVKVKGSDSQSLDDGIQALQLATRKRTTLVWTPPDGYCEPRVWDVETSNLLEPNGFDDLAYMLRNEQVFRLRLVCQPYRRGATLIVDDAGTPPSAGGTLLDNCEDDTGWATWLTSPPFAEDISVDSVIYAEGAGSIKSRLVQWTEAPDGTSSYGRSCDKVTGLSLSTGSGGYLSIKIRVEYADNPGSDPMGLTNLWVTTAAGEVEVTDFIAVSRDDQGFTQYVWLVDAGLTVTGLRFQVFQRYAGNVGRPYTWYDDIELLPSATTDHQIIKQHTVLGSARSMGSIQISAASEATALGRLLVISQPTNATPSGFRPDGRQWVTQGDTANDPTLLVHGGDYYTPDLTTYSDATGTPDRPIFDVPVGMLTAGQYMMVALVKVEGMPLVAGVQAQVLIDGTEVGATSAAEVSIPSIDTGWQFVPLGTVTLPPLPMQGADDTTRVRLLFKGAKLADIYMIPAWQVNGYAVADYTILDCGTGTVEPGGASSSAFIDSPSVTQPQGAFWRGPTTDRANAQSAFNPTDLKKPGTHFFQPGSLTNFVVSLGAAGPTSTLRYYPRWL